MSYSMFAMAHMGLSLAMLCIGVRVRRFSAGRAVYLRVRVFICAVRSVGAQELPAVGGFSCICVYVHVYRCHAEAGASRCG